MYGQLLSFSSHFRLLFWPTKLRKYLACLALQGAKAEHMEMKILRPIIGILVALMKNELMKICNQPTICL